MPSESTTWHQGNLATISTVLDLRSYTCTCKHTDTYIMRRAEQAFVHAVIRGRMSDCVSVRLSQPHRRFQLHCSFILALQTRCLQAMLSGHALRPCSQAMLSGHLLVVLFIMLVFPSSSYLFPSSSCLCSPAHDSCIPQEALGDLRLPKRCPVPAVAQCLQLS